MESSISTLKIQGITEHYKLNWKEYNMYIGLKAQVNIEEPIQIDIKTIYIHLT
jgi:hypothetical protein